MFDAGKPLQLFRQDFAFEAALAMQGDMAELRAAHRRVAVGPRPEGIGQMPEMGCPVGRRFEHVHDVGPPELGSFARVRQADPDFFAGNGVPDKHHPSLVAGNAVPAVGDGPDVHDEFGIRAGLGLGVH
jgi:hypothetical protein